MFFNIFSLAKRKTISFLFIFLLLLLSNVCYARTVYDGSVPPWITGGQNDLVMKMRSLVAKMPHNYPHGYGTTCVYSISVSLRGTPYGAKKEHGLDISQSYNDGDCKDLINTDELRLKAQEIGEWHYAGDGYSPKPGDVVITVGSARLPSGEIIYYEDGHAVMLTESGGCIYGGTYNDLDAKLGMKEIDLSPEDNYEGMRAKAGFESAVYGYIETSKYSNGAGVLNNKVNWGLDMLATIADGLNDLIDQFTVAADNVMSAMSGLGTTLILLLIIIDFATNAMECALVYSTDSSTTFLPFFIRKLMKYAFLLFIFMNWAWVINTVFLSFAQDTASVVAGGNTSSNLTQPQFLLVKGMEAISPCLNFISNAKGLTDIKNWPLLALLVIVTFFVMFWLMFSAIYLAFIFIEFYMVAAFNAIFIVFPALRFTKFIGEGGLGSLIKATIKLFVAACLVYVLAQIIDTSNMLIEFPGDINGLADGTLRIYIMLCIHICVFCYLVFRIPGKIADIFGGKVELPG